MVSEIDPYLLLIVPREQCLEGLKQVCPAKDHGHRKKQAKSQCTGDYNFFQSITVGKWCKKISQLLNVNANELIAISHNANDRDEAKQHLFFSVNLLFENVIPFFINIF